MKAIRAWWFGGSEKTVDVKVRNPSTKPLFSKRTNSVKILSDKKHENRIANWYTKDQQILHAKHFVEIVHFADVCDVEV